MTMATVAFIGLGVMGYPMAGHLVRCGYHTRVYNRTASKACQWTKDCLGEALSTPKEAAEGADMVALCVGNDEDVRSVVYGEQGVLIGMRPGTVLVDHTTTSAELAEELALACSQVGVDFIDAPVSGGQVGAEQGKLTVMCGGKESVFEAIKPVLASYAKQVKRLGPHGQGQRCKMVNQMCIAGILKGLSEALLLAKKSRLDIKQVVDVLKEGAAGSWQMENRALSMSQDQFDFGFAIDWMIKDLGLCLDEAKKHGLNPALTEEILRQYQALTAEGFGRMDTSALIKASQ